MTFNVISTGDNSASPFARAEVYVPDQLIGGDLKLVTQPIIISGGVYKRGTVLGQISTTPVVATPASTNTGNGTIGSLSATPSSLLGAYVLTAKTATTFGVVDPEGHALADATAGTAYSAGGIGFTVTAGSTAFAVGDTISVAVLDTVGTLTKSVAGASNGSQTPIAILVDDVDASLGPVTGDGYFMGEFNVRALTFDSTWTVPTLTAALRPSGIFVKSSVSAADPT